MGRNTPPAACFSVVCERYAEHILENGKGCNRMKLLSVGLTGTYHDVAARFQYFSRDLLTEGFRIAVDETNKGNYTFIGYNIVEGELSFRSYERIKGLLKKHVAAIVADRIIFGEEKKIIRQLIERNYPYFSEEERNVVCQTTLELLGKSHI